ncbi:CMRF35-like molecule 2, partial [Pterocles gutturalis]
VSQALVVLTEVSGQAGEMLSLHCWYPQGYEGYNKYWCRGGGHTQVSIQDSHIFCLVLLTIENISDDDAGSYWCRIERMGRDLMESVTVRVVPG